MQEDVFQCCAYDIVTSVLRGYNGSIIASGQTSKEIVPDVQNYILVDVFVTPNLDPPKWTPPFWGSRLGVPLGWSAV